jgi:hypothetical protein
MPISKVRMVTLLKQEVQQSSTLSRGHTLDGLSIEYRVGSYKALCVGAGWEG